MDTNMSLEALEQQLEEEAVSSGVARYDKRRVDVIDKDRVVRKATVEGDLAPAHVLVAQMLAPFNAALDNWLQGVLSGSPRRLASMVKYLDTCRSEQPNLLGVVTMRSAISLTAVAATRKRGKPAGLVSVAMNLSRILEESMHYPRLRREHPGYARKLEAELSRGGDDDRRVTLLRTAGKVTGIKAVPWAKKDCLRLGTLLLTLLAESTGMISIDLVTAGKIKRYEVTMSPRFVQWIEDAHARGQVLHPLHMPMVVPPLQWSPARVRGGGYLHGKLRLVVNLSEKKARDATAGWSDSAWASLNALQETPWRINLPVLQTMEQAWGTGGGWGKLPGREDIPLPTWPEGTGPERDTPEFKAKVADIYRVRKLNAANRSTRINFAMTLGLARRFHDMEIPFYFPHVMDFRGRVYPTSVHLSPQGDKVQRALLQFHRKQPLGEDGAFWLAVHLANCYGIDKVAFEERVQWVEENTSKIVQVAQDPLGAARDWWAAADTPWLFLAACFEWRDLVLWVQQGNPQGDFLSGLPVAMDGTCNGMQQFSALVLDEHTGSMLGMVPSPKPADIYATVADAANAIIKQDAVEGLEIAQKWLAAGGMTRKLAKRNTMTTPYSVTEYGMRGQQMGVLREMAKAGDLDWEADLVDAAYLAGVNARVIPAVITSAATVMGFLKACAGVMSRAKLPVRWTTPVGLRVTQRYPKAVSQRERVTVLGKMYALWLQHKDDMAIDSRAQELGVSPNYVHSLDASHMLATVAYCLEDGVQDFQMIHDSFGTHAGSVGVMNRNLRKAFVDMYSGTALLQQFRDEQQAALEKAGKGQLAEELPEVPPQGSLDIARIEECDYFFA